jgi:hypothetical protein
MGFLRTIRTRNQQPTTGKMPTVCAVVYQSTVSFAVTLICSHNVHIVAWTGFKLDIGFTDHLQVMTTNIYNTIADFHTLQITTR